VIEVGLKEYNFTWSPELGVCDIYEVCRNGEDGTGLLIERGSALRKMNVQRILDESAKNQVKMRSVQAELQSKSRKYSPFLIVPNSTFYSTWPSMVLLCTFINT
jgi:hypothetical protein